MALGLFIQGPMTEHEATELAGRYRKLGRRVSITPSFQPGLQYVQVYLHVSKKRPHKSNVYQQKLWK